MHSIDKVNKLKLHELGHTHEYAHMHKYIGGARYVYLLHWHNMTVQESQYKLTHMQQNPTHLPSVSTGFPVYL